MVRIHINLRIRLGLIGKNMSRQLGFRRLWGVKL